MGSCNRKTRKLKGQRQKLLLKVDVMEAHKNTNYYKIK